jgi:hypothetical protein
MYGEF